MTIVNKSVTELIPYARNSRTHSDEQVSQIMASIKEFGFTNPILTDGQNGIIAGHGRVMAAQRMKIDKVPTIELSHLTSAQKKAYIIADNKLALNSGWDEDMLKIELVELDDMGFDYSELGFDFEFDVEDIEEEEEEIKDISSKGSLSDKFGIPPFSVLNAREGWWHDRKRNWIALGISSGDGRDSGFLTTMNKIFIKAYGESVATQNNDSIFDPVMAELAYRWWCPIGGTILDPFAGGSVRGIVASKVGRQYIGGELRLEQVEANIKQANEIIKENEIMPVWINADSMIIDKTCADVKADFIFSCPPYADLEVYSNDPKDISNMNYEDFKNAYFEIIKKTCTLLKQDRFACFVVGEVRDKKGNYYNFVGDTIQAFKHAGLEYYNEAILVTPAGSLALRAGNYFTKSRKLGKSHQNVLVFLKGDAKKATEACGVCDFGEISDDLIED